MRAGPSGLAAADNKLLIVKGLLHLIEDDVLTLYDWDEKIDEYLARVALFDDWCAAQAEKEE